MSAAPVDRSPELLLGLPWAQLAALPVAGAAPLALPNGLQVWARAEMRAPDGRRGLVVGATVPAAAPDPPDAAAAVAPESAVETPPLAADVLSSKRLRESDLDLIRTTLQACGGNVSDAAKQLGVSRGLIYRRLRAVRDRD